MSVKTAGVGHFTIPTAPAAGTSVASGAANTFTTTYVQLIASTAAALYITGIFVESAGALAGTYEVVQLATGGAGSETIVGQYLVALSTGSTQASAYRPIFPPIPVANGTRIACKTANSVTTITTLITLECVAQSNVVDDGIAVGSVTTVTTVTNQLTAAAIATGVWQDAVAGDFSTASSIGKALFISNIAPGGAGGHMISGSNAGTTTLGALTVTGGTTLTGNMVLSDGITISAPSTLNRAGLDIAGNGTGAAIKAVAGGTGVGLSIAGGGTSGDGIKVTTTSGHGINSAPVGTDKHGIFVTGGNGGTSDGIKAAAGTGGVDVRGNITGNVTGNVSGSAGSVTGAVGSVTAAVTLPTIPANWITAAGINADAITDAKVAADVTIASVTGAVGSVTAGVTVTTNNDKTGYGLSSTAVQAIWDALTSALTTVGSVGKLLVDKLDAAITSRLASGSYTAPDNTSITAIKAKTDSLTFTKANEVDSNIQSVNDTTVNGNGASGTEWGP